MDDIRVEIIKDSFKKLIRNTSWLIYIFLILLLSYAKGKSDLDVGLFAFIKA